eukprot:365402-Chlamydomonas_euryale.AAC.3
MDMRPRSSGVARRCPIFTFSLKPVELCWLNSDDAVEIVYNGWPLVCPSRHQSVHGVVVS